MAFGHWPRKPGGDCPISHPCLQVACVWHPGGDPLSGKIQECHPNTTLVVGRLASCEFYL